MSGLWAVIVSRSWPVQTLTTSANTARRSVSSVMIRAVAGRSAFDGALEVEREMRVRLEVEQPGAGPIGARHAGDVQAAVEVVEHDLDPPRETRSPAGRRDVDALAVPERTADLVVHRPGDQPSAAARSAALWARLPAW